MRIINSSKKWKEYTKFTDNYINNNFVSEYSISNLFFNQTRPIIQTSKILVNLKNMNLFYRLKLGTKFNFVFKNLLNIFNDFIEKIILDNKIEIYKNKYSHKNEYKLKNNLLKLNHDLEQLSFKLKNILI